MARSFRPHSFYLPFVEQIEAGARLKDIAEQHGINAFTLRYHLDKFRAHRAPEENSREQEPLFLPVTTTAIPSGCITIKINHIELSFPLGTSPDYIQSLLRSLGRT